jgi:outer membrane protein OmpA-like peptidoglycan-associated protein
MSQNLTRVAAVLVFALGTAACSTVDDLIGDSTPAPAAATDANGFPPDTAPPQGGTTPDMAAIPAKPSGVTTPDAQAATTDSLGADRARTTYSGDALRAGTEAAAPPPAPASATPLPATVASNTPPPSAPPPSDNNDDGSAAPAAAATPPPPQPAPAPAPSSAPVAAPTAPVAAMSAPPPPGGQPAVPASTNIPGAGSAAMPDGPLGFKPSTAPPLDPSISRFVSAPIIARYQQTAAAAGSTSGVMAMNAPGNAAYANASGVTPTAVVMFPGDGTALSAAGRAQVRAAVQAYQSRGGAGFIKVVGHSSSRTGNMPLQQHLMSIFAKSQARANAVAKEIIREGVPASKVLVEAVGDSQPVYYESMPQGEAGNRRAEIFIQG